MLGWLEALYRTEQVSTGGPTIEDGDLVSNPISTNTDRLSHHLYNVYANW